MKKNGILVIISIIGFAIALCFVLWPLLQPGFYITDDGEWMVIRLSAFYQSLASGQFPVRYLGRLNNSYGYPVANFLYPGFLYIGSLLHLLGLSFVSAVKVIMGISVVGGAIAIFVALKTRFRLMSSLMGALSFVFSPYLLFDLYKRGSVGEVLAIGSFALAIFSLTKKLYWLLAPAVSLLIISHNTVALIAGAVLMGFMLVERDRYRTLPSFLLGVGISAFFWLPALWEKRFVWFDAVTVSSPGTYFIRMENAGLLGFVTIVALAFWLGGRVKRTSFDMWAAWMIIVGLALSLPISFLFWQIPIVGSFVQFPYRFLVLPVVLGPWIVAGVMEQLKGWRLIMLSLMFGVLWFMGAALQLNEIEFVERADGYYITNEATTNVANEYMPRWVSDVPPSRPVETLEVIDGDATLSARTFIGEHMIVDIDAKEISTIQINKVYYPGWGITVDNLLVPIDYENALGVMRVNVPQGAHTLVAAFRETPFRFAADVVSVISIICYFLFIRRLSKGI